MVPLRCVLRDFKKSPKHPLTHARVGRALRQLFRSEWRALISRINYRGFSRELTKTRPCTPKVRSVNKINNQSRARARQRLLPLRDVAVRSTFTDFDRDRLGSCAPVLPARRCRGNATSIRSRPLTRAHDSRQACSGCQRCVATTTSVRRTAYPFRRVTEYGRVFVTAVVSSCS